MVGIYFSGTGNTKFCVNKFLEEFNNGNNTFSIEEKAAFQEIKNNHEIVIGYPIQYSNIPKILRDYIITNQHIWKGKKKRCGPWMHLCTAWQNISELMQPR